MIFHIEHAFHELNWRAQVDDLCSPTRPCGHDFFHHGKLVLQRLLQRVLFFLRVLIQHSAGNNHIGGTQQQILGLPPRTLCTGLTHTRHSSFLTAGPK